MSEQILWLLNRSTGAVVLVLFTVTVVLGVLSTRPGPGPRWWPRFAGQGVHRQVAVLATVLLVGHIVTAVLDSFVEIHWWRAVLPWGAAYRPPYLELGAAAVDLLLVVLVSSMLRRRLGPRTWRVLHASSYLLWVAAVLHTVGIGTDVTTAWMRVLVALCVGAVGAAVAVRLADLLRRRRSERIDPSRQRLEVLR